jgi:hypothetical protein
MLKRVSVQERHSKEAGSTVLSEASGTATAEYNYVLLIDNACTSQINLNGLIRYSFWKYRFQKQCCQTGSQRRIKGVHIQTGSSIQILGNAYAFLHCRDVHRKLKMGIKRSCFRVVPSIPVFFIIYLISNQNLQIFYKLMC